MFFLQFTPEVGFSVCQSCLSHFDSLNFLKNLTVSQHFSFKTQIYLTLITNVTEHQHLSTKTTSY